MEEANPAPAAEHRPAAAFYCVADERYFLGAVGLINSLRLVGHTEPIFLLDCGLTAAQRELLAAARRAASTRPSDAPPWLLKTVAPLARPADVDGPARRRHRRHALARRS